MKKNLNFYANTTDETTIKQLVASPESIFQSIDVRNNNLMASRGIKLDTLHLS